MLNDLYLPEQLNLGDPKLQNWFDHAIYHMVRYKFAWRLAKPQDTLLDAGCGYGYGTRFLSGKTQSAVGIDLDADVIAKAKALYQRDNLQYATGDLLTMPPMPASLITCFEVIEHLNKMDASYLINRLYQDFLTEHGLLILSTPRYKPFEQRSQNRQQHHKHEYHAEELVDLVGTRFSRPILLTQTDEVISSGNPDTCWTYIILATK